MWLKKDLFNVKFMKIKIKKPKGDVRLRDKMRLDNYYCDLREHIKERHQRVTDLQPSLFEFHGSNEKKDPKVTHGFGRFSQCHVFSQARSTKTKKTKGDSMA